MGPRLLCAALLSLALSARAQDDEELDFPLPDEPVECSASACRVAGLLVSRPPGYAVRTRNAGFGWSNAKGAEVFSFEKVSGRQRRPATCNGIEYPGPARPDPRAWVEVSRRFGVCGRTAVPPNEEFGPAKDRKLPGNAAMSYWVHGFKGGPYYNVTAYILLNGEIYRGTCSLEPLKGRIKDCLSVMDTIRAAPHPSPP